MDDKNFVFQCRGDAYYYKEHSDGTSSVYPLRLSSTLGVLYFYRSSALDSRDIPPKEEWIPCPAYKLGWLKLYSTNPRYIEMIVVAYCLEKVKENIRHFIYPSLQDCFVYACKHVLSPIGQTVVIQGVGAIYYCGGVIQIDRQPQYVWELVE